MTAIVAALTAAAAAVILNGVLFYEMKLLFT